MKDLNESELSLAQELEIKRGEQETVESFRARLAAAYLEEHGDPLEAVQIMTATPYQSTPGLSLALIHANSAMSKGRAQENLDIYDHIPWKHFGMVLCERGFKSQSQEQYVTEDNRDENCGLWLHPEKAILVFADSYQGKLNGGTAYFEVEAPKSTIGKLERDLMIDALPPGSNRIYVGERWVAQALDIDIRYEPFASIEKMERNGWKYTSPWQHPAEHSLWLQNTTIMYQTPNERPSPKRKLCELPSAIQRAIGLH